MMLDGTGELPAGWVWARLGEISNITGGLTKNPKRAAWPTKLPFLRVGNVQAGYLNLSDLHKTGIQSSELPRVLLREGDLLIVEGNGSLDQLGRCAVWNGQIAPCVHQNHVIKARFAESEISEWVSLWLSSSNGRKIVEAVASSTSGLHTLSISKVSDFLVPIPPSLERQRVMSCVRKLFADLDEAEAALKRARASLAEYRASLLHAACIGQLTATWRAPRPPPAEDGATLLRRILAERRAAWERAELARLYARGKPTPVGERWKVRYPEPAAPDTDNLPELPPEWAWASLDQLSWASTYGTSAKCGTDETGMPILRIPNVQSGSIKWSNLKYTNETSDLRTSDLLSTGDLLVVRTNGSPGLLGRAAVIDCPIDRPSYFASYLIRFRLLGSPTLHRWVAAMFASGLVRQQVGRSAATSAGQYNISQTSLARFALPLPPMGEVAQLVSELADNISTDDGWPNSETIASFRQSILHAAFTGRLVPQDPADEPAAALLARLRATSARPHRTRKQARAA